MRVILPNESPSVLVCTRSLDKLGKLIDKLSFSGFDGIFLHLG